MKKSPRPKNYEEIQQKIKMNKKRAKARMRRIRRFLLFVLVVTGLIIFARSSFFIVEKIDVVGNKRYQAKDIIESTSLVTGQNVFNMLCEKPKNLLSFKFSEAEKSVYDALPYIKSVSVRPSLPKAIKIRVTERIPFVLLEVKGKNILIDKDGYSLEEVNSVKQKPKYIKVYGTTAQSYKLGQAVSFKETSPMPDLISFIDLMKKNDKDTKLKLYDKLTSVDMSEVNCFTVRLDDRITAKFGDLEQVDYQMSVLKHLFVNNINAKQKGTIDFTKSSNPFFIPEN